VWLIREEVPMLLVSGKLQVRTVALPGGVRLEYVEQGDGAGAPVVMLHGVTDSWRSFSGVLSHLPNGLRAFALSQRGHGDSSRPPAGYAPGDFAGDVAAFLDAHDLPSAVIVGHSMGSLVAQRFAIDYPDRTTGLVLMGSTPRMRTNAGVREFRDNVIETLADPLDPAFVLEFQQSTLARPTPAGLIDTVVQESLKVPARVWRDAFTGFVDMDYTAELGRITAPTLVVWGTADAYFLRHEQEALLSGIRGATFIAYDGAGHGFHWEEPFRFAADLVRFCRALPI
jgi:pimeloyl-ACP methyl ester carboxylesterase